VGGVGGSGGLFDFLDDAVRNFLEWHPRGGWGGGMYTVGVPCLVQCMLDWSGPDW
jgi:hypothetical protein